MAVVLDINTMQTKSGVILLSDFASIPTILVSTDQDTEEGRYCPKCNSDWRSTQIPPTDVAAGYYGHEDPCQKMREWDDGFDASTPCTCPPRYFSCLVGIEIPGKSEHDIS